MEERIHNAFFGGFILGSLAFGAIGFIMYQSNTQITSKHQINPEVTITVKDGKSDTVFVYRKP